MSRNVYRLCNTSHTQSKPANTKIIQTIVYWLGQLFSKPRLTMVCITPVQPQLQHPLSGNKAVLANQYNHSSDSTITSQKNLASRFDETEEQSQDLSDKWPSNSNRNSTFSTNNQSISSSDTPLSKAGKKANLLFLKVYNGPIFQDKKVDPTVKTQAQTSTPTSQSVQSAQSAQSAQPVFSVQDPFCSPNQGLSPSCLQMLNTSKQGKKPVFMSGKMSDIFAQLDQLAA
jgi:hypothetical protein